MAGSVKFLSVNLYKIKAIFDTEVILLNNVVYKDVRDSISERNVSILNGDMNLLRMFAIYGKEVNEKPLFIPFLEILSETILELQVMEMLV